MALATGQVFAGYEILAELGRGGMGAVYQARQIALQRVVALKILPPHLASDQDFITRFQAEAVAAAHLNHPNIVHVYTAGEAEGIEYIAMEYIEGETIQQRLRRCGRLPLTEALDIAYHVAAALDYAWQTAQLIHRDVKPDNIFLAQNGTVKLGDFGLAKFLREGALSVTMTGQVMGSPHFISPEQARGQRDSDWRSDLYSLGCTLQYMMTGRTVFEGPDFVSVMYKHVNETPEPLDTLLPNCPASARRLVARMIAKEREQRPQTYGDLLEEIMQARSEAAIWEQSDERQQRRMSQPEPPRRTSLRAYAVAAVLALLVAAGFFHGRRSERTWAVTSAVTLADASDRRDFVRRIEKLSTLEGFERVMDKLRELNPGFTGKEDFTYVGGEITELSFSSVGVKNLWPLCALPHLRVLNCPGDATNRVRGELADLSPLAELPLEELDCRWTNVEDLRPLAKLQLKVLRCGNTKVQRLDALKGRPLTELDISSTDISDLAPLAGMPLTVLHFQDTRVRNLSVLRGMPLKTVSFHPEFFQRGEVEIVRSWSQLETINGLSRSEVGTRFPRLRKELGR